MRVCGRAEVQRSGCSGAPGWGVSSPGQGLLPRGRRAGRRVCAAPSPAPGSWLSPTGGFPAAARRATRPCPAPGTLAARVRGPGTGMPGRTGTARCASRAAARVRGGAWRKDPLPPLQCPGPAGPALLEALVVPLDLDHQPGVRGSTSLTRQPSPLLESRAHPSDESRAGDRGTRRYRVVTQATGSQGPARADALANSPSQVPSPALAEAGREPGPAEGLGERRR